MFWSFSFVPLTFFNEYNGSFTYYVIEYRVMLNFNFVIGFFWIKHILPIVILIEDSQSQLKTKSNWISFLSKEKNWRKKKRYSVFNKLIPPRIPNTVVNSCIIRASSKKLLITWEILFFIRTTSNLLKQKVFRNRSKHLKHISRSITCNVQFHISINSMRTRN